MQQTKFQARARARVRLRARRLVRLRAHGECQCAASTWRACASRHRSSTRAARSSPVRTPARPRPLHRCPSGAPAMLHRGSRLEEGRLDVRGARAGAPCGFAGSRGMVRTRIMRGVYICEVSSGDIMGDILIVVLRYPTAAQDTHSVWCACATFCEDKAARGPLVLPKYLLTYSLTLLTD